MSGNEIGEPTIGIEEAAEYTGLSVGTIYNRVGRGEIPFLRAGRLLRFRRSELDAWMTSHREPVAEEPAA